MLPNKQKVYSTAWKCSRFRQGLAHQTRRGLYTTAMKEYPVFCLERVGREGKPPTWCTSSHRQTAKWVDRGHTRNGVWWRDTHGLSWRDDSTTSKMFLGPKWIQKGQKCPIGLWSSVTQEMIFLCMSSGYTSTEIYIKKYEAKFGCSPRISPVC